MAEKTKLTKEQKAAAKAKKKAEKKQSKVGTFFKNLKAELKKISWYSAHDTIQNSIWVIVAMVICAIIPILIIYPYIQKYFAKGANLGGVKE